MDQLSKKEKKKAIRKIRKQAARQLVKAAGKPTVPGPKPTIQKRTRRQNRPARANPYNSMHLSGLGTPIITQVPGLAPMLKEATKNPYLINLLAPGLGKFSDKSRKLPGRSGGLSAVYCSRQMFEVQMPGDNAADPKNKGRFAFCLQPKFGDGGNDPTQYKVAMVSSNYDWDETAISNQANGTTYDQNEILDPRFSDFFNTAGLTQVGDGQTSQTAAKPFGTGLVLEQDGVYESSYCGMDYVGSGTNSRFFFRPGRWQVDWIVTGTGITGFTYDGVTGFLPHGTGITFVEFVPSSTPTGGSTLTRCIASATFDVSGLDSAQNYIDISCVAASTVTAAKVIATPKEINVPNDQGMIVKVRPVAMATLVTYMGESFHNGGMIQAARVPAGIAEEYFFGDNVGRDKSLHYWENFADQNFKGYNGPIKKGCYAWWLPENDLDENLYPPSVQNGRTYPSLIVAGNYQSTDNTVPSGLLRVYVWTIFEYTTESRVVPVSDMVVNPVMKNNAVALAVKFPCAMSNKNHGPAIKEFLRKVGIGIDKFFDEGTKAISKYAGNLVPGAKAAAQIAKEAGPVLALL